MTIDMPAIRQLLINTSQQVLMPLFREVRREYKADGSIVTLADKRMQSVLSEALLTLYPDTIVLGEEMSTNEQAATLTQSKAIWCLDPVDGSSNFASGLPFFSISLALIQDQQVTHGLVYDPIAEECFWAIAGQGAWLNDTPLVSKFSELSMSQTIALIDFKRLPKALATRILKNRPYGSHRCLGSVALELCWLAAGRAHLYLHGRQQLWDYAAAQLIVQESGAFAATLQDEPVFAHSLSSRSTYAAVDEHLFATWRDYLRIPLIDE